MITERLINALTKATHIELHTDERAGKHVIVLSFADKDAAADAFMGVSYLQDAATGDEDED